MVYYQLKDMETFTRDEYFRAVRDTAGAESVNALSYILRKDVSDGELLRIGKNRYTYSKEKRIYTHEYSDEATGVVNEILKEYPEADFRVFELIQLNPFVNHQIAHNTIIVSVEKDLMDYVFDTLRQKHPGKVMFKPSVADYYRYLVENEIVIVRLASESPKGVGDFWRSRLELITGIVSAGEYETIFEEAFKHYYVDERTMFRYAKRKGAYEKFRDILCEYAPFVLGEEHA